MQKYFILFIVFIILLIIFLIDICCCNLSRCLYTNSIYLGIHSFKGSNPNFEMEDEFDITPLQASNAHRFTDHRGAASGNYSYYINFCANIEKNPSDHCANWTAISAVQASAAFGCIELGYDYKDLEWGLIDATDPSKGLRLVYRGTNKWCGNYRSTFVNINCKDTDVLDTSTPVVEGSCSYSLELNSVFGCPTGCNLGHRRLCGEHGVCKFDLDSRRSHCYCNKGWSGNNCLTSGNESTTLDSTDYILIVACVFELLVFLVVIVVWKKVKGLKLDKTIYQQNEQGVRVKVEYEKL